MVSVICPCTAKIEQILTHEEQLGTSMSSEEEGENKKNNPQSLFLFVKTTVTSQCCFVWIQKSGQLIKLMHCRDPQNSLILSAFVTFNPSVVKFHGTIKVLPSVYSTEFHSFYLLLITFAAITYKIIFFFTKN